MSILVIDSSVLIDLERGGLLESMFGVGLNFVVPDLLYQRELVDANGPLLKSLGLAVVELSSTEVSLAQEIRRSTPGLSLPDAFALACATRADHELLTGDGALRSEAQSRSVIVHGVLWLLDVVEQHGTVPRAQLYESLTRIAAHPRCRLPKAQVNTRLSRWE